MQGQLGLLEQDRGSLAPDLHERPQQADQPQGPVTEVTLVLAGTTGSPIGVPALQVRATGAVHLHLQGGELGNRELQGGRDPAQPCVARLRSDPVHPGDEVTAERVVEGVAGTGGVPDDLRDEVQVPGLGEEVRDVTEVLVLRDLLQRGLGETLRVVPVLVVWALEQDTVAVPDGLLGHDGAVQTTRFAADRDRVGPGLAAVATDGDRDRHPAVVVVPGEQTPHSTETATGPDRVLQAAARRG